MLAEIISSFETVTPVIYILSLLVNVIPDAVSMTKLVVAPESDVFKVPVTDPCVTTVPAFLVIPC